MSKYISIDNVQTILSVLGEEDTCIDFEGDSEVQSAIELLQAKIQARLDEGIVVANDTLIVFE